MNPITPCKTETTTSGERDRTEDRSAREQSAMLLTDLRRAALQRNTAQPSRVRPATTSLGDREVPLDRTPDRALAPRPTDEPVRPDALRPLEPSTSLMDEQANVAPAVRTPSGDPAPSGDAIPDRFEAPSVIPCVPPAVIAPPSAPAAAGTAPSFMRAPGLTAEVIDRIVRVCHADRTREGRLRLRVDFDLGRSDALSMHVVSQGEGQVSLQFQGRHSPLSGDELDRIVQRLAARGVRVVDTQVNRA